MSLAVDRVREDFPILTRKVGKYPLTYMDSANTAQKPIQVIDRVAEHFRVHNANVARAMHRLGEEATSAYEQARSKVGGFIGAKTAEEVIFTKNASEALNLAANVLGKKLSPGDEVVISVMEHHSNLVPWQLVCERTGAKLRWFDVTDDGRLDVAKAEAEDLINEKTRVVSLTWVSNVLGCINPIRKISDWAHKFGAIMVVDGSQGVPHMPTAVDSLGADMLAFTGHKMCAPTGIGVLWGKYDLLETLPPFMGGGEMIEVVRMEGSTYALPPARFEAGTPPIGQAIGLGAAIDYLNSIGMADIAQHDHEITGYMLEQLGQIDGLRIVGPTENVDRGAAVSFTLENVHPHDIMQLTDARGVAVRGGHHCAAPLHQRFAINSTTRASAYFYTTKEEVDRLAEALIYTRDFFAGKMRGR